LHRHLRPEKGQLQEAKATLLGVELDAKRAKELFEGKVISEQEYTNKTQLYQTKLAAVTAAQTAPCDASFGFVMLLTVRSEIGRSPRPLQARSIAMQPRLTIVLP